MPARFFGQFLLEKGVVTREALLNSLDTQNEKNLPFGILALEKKYLTLEQMSRLQAEHFRTGRKFWVLALEHRLMSKEQIAALLRTQVESRGFLGEILVSQGHLTEEQLERLLEEYRNEQQAVDTDVAKHMASAPHRAVAEVALDQTLATYAKLIGDPIKIKSVSDKPEEIPGIEYIFSQNITGDEPFTYSLALPISRISSIGSIMASADQIDITAIMVDAVAEFVNIVVGSICAKLRMTQEKIGTEPPQVSKGTRVDQYPPGSVFVTITSPKGDFGVWMFFFPRTGK